jgi:hypothetical protein
MERLHDVNHCTNKLSVIFFDNNIIRFVQIFARYAHQKKGRLQEPPLYLLVASFGLGQSAAVETNTVAAI